MSGIRGKTRSIASPRHYSPFHIYLAAETRRRGGNADQNSLCASVPLRLVSEKCFRYDDVGVVPSLADAHDDRRRDHGIAARYTIDATPVLIWIPGIPQIVQGQFLEVGSAEWKLIRLYEDGTLIARVPGDEEFLSWASIRRGGQDFWQHPRLNPITLIEFIYTFSDLYGRLIDFLSPLPPKLRIRAQFKNLHHDAARVYLTPHGLETASWHFEMTKYPAPEPAMQRQIDVDSSTLKERPARVGYLVTEQVYTWFGAAPEAIPYVSEQHGERVVDVEALKQRRIKRRISACPLS